MILSRPIAGLRALMRRVTSEDGGSSIMEVMGAMVVITIVTSSFLLSFNNMSAAQNKAQSVDIAGQYARGILEEAKSTPWSKLCFGTTDAGYRAIRPASPGSPAAATAKCTGTLGAPATRLMPTSTVKVRGVDVTLRTDITNESASSNLRTVTVEATFKRGTKTSTSTYSTLVSARPDLMPPPGVPVQAL